MSKSFGKPEPTWVDPPELNLGPILSEREIEVAVKFGADEAELRNANRARISEFKSAMINFTKGLGKQRKKVS